MQEEQHSEFAHNPAQGSTAHPDMKEIATTLDGRDITRGYVDPMMIQPTTDSVLLTRGGGDYQVYRQVLRDDQVASCFQQRQLAIAAKEWAVEPGGSMRKDKMAAEFITEQLKHVRWDEATKKMLFGIFYGFAVAEAMWGKDASYITLDKIIVRDRRRFGYDGAGRLRMRTFSNPEGELMPDRKFWTYVCGGDHDDEPYGIGLAHWLYWPVFFKRNGIKYWLIFLEKFGQPTAMGTYPPGALEAERKKLLNALSAINTDTGIIKPEGMQVELLEAARSGTADYTVLCDRMDKAIAKVIIGQTASSEGTPGRLGNDDLQGDVRDDIIKADADLICESFNMSIGRWLTEWNFPGAAVPRVYRICEEGEDLNELAERDTKIKALGFKPTLKHIQDTYGGDWVESTDSPLVPTGLNGNQPPADFAERGATMTDQVDDALQQVTDTWIEQIRALVDNAATLDEIRDGLVQLMPDMELTQYAGLMAEALRVAQLKGRDDIMREAAGDN